jgi:hypothetical protein
VLDDLRANPPLGPDVNVLTATGPHFITRVLQALPRREQLNMFIPPTEWFSPRVPRSGRQYRAVADAGVAYGIHHCHGSWREFTLRQRLRNKVSHFIRRFV